MSEWPKETGCKPVGSAYVGSNPSGPTTASGPVDVIYRADVVSDSIWRYLKQGIDQDEVEFTVGRCD